MAMPPDEPGEHSAIPPRWTGGTAIECAMTTEAVIGLAADRPLGGSAAATYRA